jgi:aminoglycoside phosphotransferase (APT) family kinase protein
LALDAEPGDDPGHEAAVASARGQIAAFGHGISDAARHAAFDVLDQPPDVRHEPVLLHGDFFPEHVLLHEGVPAAVIDWGCLSMGDPAEDIAGLFYWGGDQMLAPGLARYALDRGVGAGERERIAARVRHTCVLRAADDLEYGTAARRPEYFEMARRFLERLAEESRLTAR